MTRTLLSALTLTLLGGTALTGTALAQAPMVIALSADIRSSNPGVNRDDNTDGVVLQSVEGLVGYADDGTVGPLLAEKVEMSADGKTYTFTLRQGVKFHNGADLTSADVLWNWARYMDPKNEWRCISEFDGRNALKVESVEAPDAKTVVMKINAPNALFLDTMARTDCAMVGIVHKDSLKADGSWDKPVGTGPYKFGDWKRGEYITVTAFDDYKSPPGAAPNGYLGNKTPKVKDVRFLVVKDPATVKAGLLAGSIDVAELLDSDVAELQKNPAVQVKVGSNPVRHTFIMQTRDPLMGNVKLRQAIAAAIDFKEVVSTASNDLGKVNNSAIFPGSAYYSDVQKVGHKYDPALAKKLLAEAGYKGEKITIVTNKRPTVPSFPAAVVAQAMLQAVGVNVELEVIDWATQIDRYNKGNYMMQSFSYSARFDPALGYEQFSGPKDKQPRKIWDDPKAQALIDKSMVVTDRGERQKLFDDLHKQLIADVPLIILYNGVESTGLGKRVKDYRNWASKPRAWAIVPN